MQAKDLMAFSQLPMTEILKMLDYLYGRRALEDVCSSAWRQATSGDVLPVDHVFVWPAT